MSLRPNFSRQVRSRLVPSMKIIDVGDSTSAGFSTGIDASVTRAVYLSVLQPSNNPNGVFEMDKESICTPQSARNFIGGRRDNPWAQTAGRCTRLRFPVCPARD